MKFAQYLLHQPRYHILALALILVVLLAVIEYTLKYTISLSVLYVIPVAVSAVALGMRGGLMASLSSVMARFVSASMLTGWQSLDLYIYLNGALGFAAYLFITFLLANVKDAFTQEWVQARTDVLTGLPTPEVFLDEASRRLGQARIKKTTMTAVMVSLNNFSSYVSTVGSETSNGLLHTLGTAIGRILRRNDLLSRINDNTFMIVLPEIGKDQAELILQRVGRHFQGTLRRNEAPLTYVMASTTFVQLPKNINALKDILSEQANKNRDPNQNTQVHDVIEVSTG